MSTEKQLTAIDWLIENMPNLSHKIGLGLALEITAKFQQAKERERQQLIDAVNNMSNVLIANDVMVSQINNINANLYKNYDLSKNYI